MNYARMIDEVNLIVENTYTDKSYVATLSNANIMRVWKNCDLIIEYFSEFHRDGIEITIAERLKGEILKFFPEYGI